MSLTVGMKSTSTSALGLLMIVTIHGSHVSEGWQHLTEGSEPVDPIQLSMLEDQHHHHHGALYDRTHHLDPEVYVQIWSDDPPTQTVGARSVAHWLQNDLSEGSISEIITTNLLPRLFSFLNHHTDSSQNSYYARNLN